MARPVGLIFILLTRVKGVIMSLALHYWIYQYFIYTGTLYIYKAWRKSATTNPIHTFWWAITATQTQPIRTLLWMLHIILCVSESLGRYPLGAERPLISSSLILPHTHRHSRGNSDYTRDWPELFAIMDANIRGRSVLICLHLANRGYSLSNSCPYLCGWERIGHQWAIRRYSDPSHYYSSTSLHNDVI